MAKKHEAGKITVGTKLAYGVGQIGDTIPYTLFYTFFLIYLTDVAGIKPIIAGSISGIAILWNAILDPIIGYISDNCRSKYGRRRVFMGRIIIPYTIILALLFFPVEMNDVVKSIYYVALGISLWTCYTVWVIPYLSLVSDMTSDHNERNDMRMYNVVAAALFMAAALSGPLAIQEVLFSAGYSVKFGWGVSGGIFAAATGLGLFLSWNFLRGREPDVSNLPREKKTSLFAVIKKALKIRAFRQICLMTVAGIIGITVVESVEMYLFKNRLGMSEGTISSFYLLYSIAGVIMVPVISKLMNRFGKREIFICASIIATAGAALFSIIGINSITQLVIYVILLFSLFSGVFWIVYVTFAYDVAEIYEYKYDERHDGSIIAVVDLSYKIGAALASFLAGALLTAIGYTAGADPQPQSVLDGISLISTLPAAIAFAIAGIIIFLYPVTKPKYNALVAGIKARKENRPYDESEFKELLR